MTEKIEYHELAKIFPLIPDLEFRDLVEDIKAHGVREPIWLYEGKILDGRNRYRASAVAKIDCPMREYRGKEPLDFIVSMNLKRRHLNASQLAFVALEIESIEAELAKQRMSDGGKKKGKLLMASLGQARDKAAKKIGVGRQYVSDAKSIAKKEPELAKEIRAGKKTITQAKREIKERNREARRTENRKKIASATPSDKAVIGKFSSIVIDPPWDWGDEGDKDQLGRAKPDYGTMSLSELIKLPVTKFSDDDCHLYLWITNRSLPKGFGLLEKWGFRYVTMLTWVKPNYGMGNYFRGQTEHILFGVKGSQLLKRKDCGTVFHAKRGKGGHSSKPEEFYDIVESCSPGPYLEMFSRSERKDWTSWGENSNAKAA